MRKKMPIFLVLVLLSFLTFINNVNAKITTGVPSTSGGSGGNGGGSGTPAHTTISLGSEGNSTYKCTYYYYVNSNTSITFDAFNKDNKSILSGNLTAKENISAGTAIGISIIETQSVSWGIYRNLTFVEKTTKIDPIYGCYQKCTPTKKAAGICTTTLYDNYRNGCRTGYRRYTIQDAITKTETLKSGAKFNECIEKAEKRINQSNKKMSPSYQLDLKDSNDIDGKSSGSIYTNVTTNCQTDSNSKTCTFSYQPGKVCLNVKTAAVRYLKNASSNCNNDEIEVKNDKDHWHYFVPLNAKSDDSFFVGVKKSGSAAKLGESECLYVINHYSYYKDAIIKADGNKFSSNKTTAKKEAKKGCYFESTINIPVTQKFYDEKTVKGQKVLNGYSFYVRPIDIKNPFPNGLDSSSYWYDWYKSSKKNPDLTKSFDKMTYIASNINASSVRSYNASNPYTSWQNMNINGKSSYINGSVITRNFTVNKNSFYKLGCGPSNKSWEECK